MGDFLPMGVAFGLGIDNAEALDASSQVRKELEGGIPAAAKRGGAGVADGLAPGERALLSQREAVRLMGEEMGIHLPRGVSSGIAKMLPDITMLGGAFMAAFVIKEIPAFIAKIHEETDEIGGFTKEVKGYYEEALKEQRKLFREFTDRAQGMEFIKQTQQSIHNLADEKAELEKVTLAQSLLSDQIEGYVAAKIREHQIDVEDAKLRDVLEAQLKNLNKLQTTKVTPGVEDATKAVNHHTQLLKLLAERSRLAGKQLDEDAKHVKDYAAQAQFAANAEFNLTMRLEEFGIVGQRVWSGAGDYIDSVAPHVEVAIEQQSRWRRALLLTKDAEDDALVSQAASLAGAMAGRRVAAGIEAVWETAKGIQSLADSHFREAALHFMSAAEFGIIAGTSSHSHAAGGGYGYGGREPHYLNAEGSGIRNRESGISSGSGGGGTTVVLNIAGHLMANPESIDFLTQQISAAVEFRDARLVSSHTKDSTLIRDSFNG